jgi:hypothetical protein
MVCGSSRARYKWADALVRGVSGTSLSTSKVFPLDASGVWVAGGLVFGSLGRFIRLCGCFVGCFGLKMGVYWFLEFRGFGLSVRTLISIYLDNDITVEQ